MLVDRRVGSVEFLKPLRTMGLPVRKATLRCADFAFTGRGPLGPVLVGVERKTVAEILGMAFTDDRRFYRKQLPRMLARYDYVWLVVEGYTNPDRHSGTLMSGHFEAGFGPRRYMYESYKKSLLSIAVRAKVFIEPTKSFTETLHFLHALYRWWEKPYASHTSVLHVDHQEADRVILDERTIQRQIFAQIPDIGWVRSKQVAKYFGCIATACDATEAQWREALGIREGTVIIRRVMDMLHGHSTAAGKGR